MSSRYIRLGDIALSVSVHTQVQPSAEEWAEHLRDAGEAIAIAGRDGARLRGIAITDGGAPNAKMRRALADLLQGQPIRAVAVTANPIVRGVISAITWLSPGLNFRAYGPERFDEALAFLGLRKEDMGRILEVTQELAATLGGPARTVQSLMAGAGQR